MKNFILKPAIALVFAFLYLSDVNSQNLYSTFSYQSLDTIQQKVAERYFTDSEYSNKIIVAFKSLHDIQNNGIIAVNDIFFGIEQFQFKVNYAEYEDSLNYSWAGDRMLQDSTFLPERLNLVMVKGLLHGSISIGNNFFRIIPIDSSKQILLKSAFTSTGTALPTIHQSTEESSAPCSMNNLKCTINIMIVFTPKAKQEYPNIASIAYAFVSETNAALSVSQIAHNFKIGAIEQLSTWQEGNYQQEFDQLEAAFSPSSNLSNIRKSSGADVVVLLSKGTDWGTLHGQTYPSPTTLTKAFSIIRISSALSKRFTFIHEMAHFLGADHQEGQPDLAPFPARAHELKVSGNTYRTVVWSGYDLSDPQIRIAQYSNPNVKYSGKATGSANHNNACVMQNNGCSISKLNDVEKFPCGLKVNGTFNSSGCTPPSLLSLTVDITSTPPYNCNLSNHFIKFDRSFDGVNYQNVCSTVSTNCTVPLNNGYTFSNAIFIKTQIINSSTLKVAGQSFDIFKPNCFNFEAIDRSSIKNDEEYLFWPNPADSYIELGSYDFNRVSIITVQGQVVQTLLSNEKTHIVSNNTIELLSNLKGLYFLLFERDGNKTVKKIIIQ